jgi:hypothetical protein
MLKAPVFSTIHAGFLTYSTNSSSNHMYTLDLPLARLTHAAAVIAWSCTIVIAYKFKRTCT